MAYYIALVLSPILMQLAQNCRYRYIPVLKKKTRIPEKVFIALSFFAMFIIAAIRYDVGPDYPKYVHNFENMDWAAFQWLAFRTEPGVILLTNLIKLFTADPLWFFAVCSAITYGLAYKWILDSTDSWAFALFLYVAFGYYISAYMGVRQWLAAPMVFLAYEALKNKKHIKAVLLVALAIMFHFSAAFALPILWYVHKPRKTWLHILLMVCSTLVYIFPGLVMGALAQVLSLFGRFQKYVKYLDAEWELDGNPLANPLFCLVTFILLYIYRKPLLKRDPNNAIYANLVAVAYCVAIVGQRVFVVNRLQWYIVPVIVIALTKVSENVKKEDRTLFRVLCVILGFLFFTYVLLDGAGGGVPYQTIFSR